MWPDVFSSSVILFGLDIIYVKKHFISCHSSYLTGTIIYEKTFYKTAESYKVHTVEQLA
jgi:hypothetical protein